MCRHRGNRIVRADDGNAKNFMCSYHGWTYSNEGKLVSVPGLQEAYYGELDVDNLGLVSVAHLDTYAGFVFATWAEDAPTLEAYLGDMRYYLDMRFNRSDGGVELIGPDKWIIPNNWKNSADNFIGDAYHAAISHRSATLARMAVSRQSPQTGKPYESPGGNQVNPGNGHGQQVFLFDSADEAKQRQFQQGSSVIAEYEQSLLPEIERRLGYKRARLMRTAHNTVFPNFSSLTGARPTRLWHPRGPLHTEVWAFWCVEENASEEVKRAYRINGIQSFGPTGLLEQDDMDNWRNATDAGRSIQARKYLQNIAMGVGHEQRNPGIPGRSVPSSFSEINQRAMYVRWQEMMNAESWADISIDPITVQFEGTATMKG
jgi:phenylpropionate dioxygenase-like ring-hydroxylating dioxygenase large terminal subunit